MRRDTCANSKQNLNRVKCIKKSLYTGAYRLVKSCQFIEKNALII
jgi:hypothetical protein